MMGKGSPTSSSSSSKWSSTNVINSIYNNSNKKHHLQYLFTSTLSSQILKTNVYRINSSCSGKSRRRSSSSERGTKSGDLCTDLELGLINPPPDTSTTNSSSSSSSSSSRGHHWRLQWPPTRPLLEGALASKVSDGDENKIRTTRCPNYNTLLVKVYLDGNGIGRKLNLFALRGYHDLSIVLSYMFNPANIQCPLEAEAYLKVGNKRNQYYVLTYEDKEGDWRMVGDVPWKMFLTSVKRLQIRRADRCELE